MSNTISPFKFLNPYTREDEGAFFGRAEESRALYQSVNKNRLVLLYGPSGSGKTSLVQCGLGNRFELTDWLPIFIRRGDNIIDALVEALGSDPAINEEFVPAGPDKLDGRLEFILQAILNLGKRYLRPVYLIFDQFEELLILNDPTRKELESFIDLIENILQAPEAQSCHLLFILREEYLARLYPFEERIPSFIDRRIRVEAMSTIKIREEIILPLLDYHNITLENPDRDSREIVISLSKKHTIELPYLQVYLDMLWRKAVTERRNPNNQVRITGQHISDLGSFESSVLEAFLEEREVIIQRNHFSSKANFVRWVLDGLITQDGTKRPVYFEKEKNQLYLRDPIPEKLSRLGSPDVLRCLRLLEDNRICKIDGDAFELAHDSLAQLIEDRRTDDERKISEYRRQIATGYEVYQRTKGVLRAKQVTIYGEVLEELDLSPELTDFFNISEFRAQLKRVGAYAILIVVAACFALLYYYNRNDAVREAQKYQTLRDSLASVFRATSNQRDSARIAANKAYEALEELKFEEAYKQLTSGLKTWGEDPIPERVMADGRELSYYLMEINELQKARNLLGLLRYPSIPGMEEQILLSRDSFYTYLKIQYTPEQLQSIEDKFFPVLMPIEGGTFTMGLDSVLVERMQENPELKGFKEEAHLPEKQPHLVQVDEFEMGQTEVTILQYHLFCKATDRPTPEGLILNSDYSALSPMYRVSWYDALRYCNWLSERDVNRPIYNFNQTGFNGTLDKKDWGQAYRLPTEAEWEFAAKDPEEVHIFSGSDDFRQVAWLIGSDKTHPPEPVKTIPQPNARGLYDLNGNVWEWCFDVFDDYSNEDQDNPVGPRLSYGPNGFRVARGGAITSSPLNGTVISRIKSDPMKITTFYRGFRVVRSK